MSIEAKQSTKLIFLGCYNSVTESFTFLSENRYVLGWLVFGAVPWSKGVPGVRGRYSLVK